MPWYLQWLLAGLVWSLARFFLVLLLGRFNQKAKAALEDFSAGLFIIMVVIWPIDIIEMVLKVGFAVSRGLSKWSTLRRLHRGSLDDQ